MLSTCKGMAFLILGVIKHILGEARAPLIDERATYFTLRYVYGANYGWNLPTEIKLIRELPFC